MITTEQFDLLNRITANDRFSRYSKMDLPEGIWKYNEETGLIDCWGGVFIENEMIKDNRGLLGIKFGKITGDFILDRVSVENCLGLPEEVTGNLELFSNNIRSLIGGTKKVGGNFSCYSNDLISLKGIPSINGSIYIKSNLLASLKYCPEEVNGDFNCGSNELKSLLYGPKVVKGNYICGNNQLESLEGLAQRIDGDLFFPNNYLKSLKGLVKPGKNIRYRHHGVSTMPNKNSISYEGFEIIINKLYELADYQISLSVVWNDLSDSDKKVLEIDLPEDWETFSEIGKYGIL